MDELIKRITQNVLTHWGLTEYASGTVISTDPLNVQLNESIEMCIRDSIITYLDNAEVDRQQVTAISELVNNDFVEFRGTGDLSTQAVTKLTGGINGSSPIANYESFFELLKTQS